MNQSSGFSWSTKLPSGNRPGEGTPIGIVRFPWGGEETWIRYESGMLTPGFEGDPEYVPMWAGLSVDAVRDVRSAADIVRDLAREAEAALGPWE